MTTSFRQLRQHLGPRWLTEGEGGLIGYALDTLKDAFVERAMWGLLARFPEVAPDDAVPLIGRDRRVVRGRNELLESYRARLLRWLDDRQRCGNAFALMQKLAEYTGPLPKFRTVDARGNWYTRNPDGTIEWSLNTGNWNWDGPIGDRWSRFWVIIYPNGLWTVAPDQAWGDADAPDWGEDTGWTWGSTASPEEVDTIRGIVADWKPAGTRCVNIILAFDNASFSPSSPEPDGTWKYDGKNVAGVRVPARLATARYWDGV